jgi:hypothetical protein
MQLKDVNNLLIVEKMYNSVYKTNRDFEVFFNGKIIPNDSKVVEAKGNMVFLKDIIEENTLILRYSDLNCNTCIDTMINNLFSISSFTGNINIIMLVTSQDTNYISLLKKGKNISFPIYKLSAELDKLFTDINLPYFFIIEKSITSIRINSTFVPLKEDQDLTHNYLQNVVQQYFR